MINIIRVINLNTSHVKVNPAWNHGRLYTS